MKKIIIATMCVFCATAVRAENDNAATSKEYVDAELATKQPTVPAAGDNVVMTFDSNATDGIGTKNIYDPSGDYASQMDALVTAQTANSAVQMAINGEFYCKEYSTIVENDCWLWGIKTPDTVQSKNLFDFNNAAVLRKSQDVLLTKLSDGYSLVVPHAGTQNDINTIVLELGDLDDFIGKTLTASAKNISTAKGGVALLSFVQTDSNGKLLCNNGIGIVTLSKKCAPDATKLGLAVYVTGGGSFNANATSIYRNIQVEEGSSATAYEPYGGLYIPQNVQ